MPEGALKETIKNHFSKIETMTDINMLNPDYAIGKFQSKQTYYKI